MSVEPIRWYDNELQLLDQRKLPREVVWIRCREAHQVAVAIRDMVVRGAPAIGVAAAFGIVLAALRGDDVRAAAAELRSARPTAVNLMWAVDRMMWRTDNLICPARQDCLASTSPSPGGTISRTCSQPLPPRAPSAFRGGESSAA